MHNATADLLAQLEARRDALVREVIDLQQRVADATEHLRQKQLTLESVLELLRIEGGTTSTGLDKRHFLEAAFDHLLSSGPLHYSKLCAELIAQGIFIPGSRPEANLLTHINRDNRFVRVGRGEYGVAGNRGKKVKGSAR